MTTNPPLFSEAPPRLPSVVSIGTFDGVHLGHQALLNRLREESASSGARTLVVTFDPPPRAVLRPDDSYRLIVSLDERVERLRACGVDEVVVLQFSREVAAIDAADFVEALVERLGMIQLVGGPDLALGRGRRGTPGVLRELGDRHGFGVTVLDQFTLGEQPVRSGEVRASLTAGDVRQAATLLGRPPTLRGRVVEGDRRGRTIGVPTANLSIPEHRLLPANGVYAVRARLVDNETHPAVANIGVRPTVDGVQQTVEVHILDFDRDLYGTTMTIDLLEKLRDEQRFASLDALVAQIKQDIQTARQVLGRH